MSSGSFPPKVDGFVLQTKHVNFTIVGQPEGGRAAEARNLEGVNLGVVEELAHVRMASVATN